MQIRTLIGLEVLKNNPMIAKNWGLCGLLLNPSSLTAEFEPAWKVCLEVLGPQRLKALYGPQHGLDGVEQDNMIETQHSTHIETGLPVFSLYSETREPTEKMLANIDTLVIDLQIVGCRIYTWKSTIGACLTAAKKFGKKIVILDRPNPLGGVIVEGNVLEPEAKSFVGQFPTPMRHGLTVGESARFFNSFIGADLEVVELKNWDATKDWRATHRPWIITSPNLPTLESVFVYPGTVMFEGTNISEGRGTSMPFQFIGAPYIKSSKKFVQLVEKYAAKKGLEGVFLRPLSFKPTFHKWANHNCQGMQIHVTEPEKIRSFSLALSIIQAAIIENQGFEWNEPPYEYNYEITPIKLIIGSLKALDAFGDKFDVDDAFWVKGATQFIETVKPYLLYPREMKVG